MEIQEIEMLKEKKQELSKSRSLIKRRAKSKLSEFCNFNDSKNECEINFKSINDFIEANLMIIKLLGYKVIIICKEDDKANEYLQKLNALFNVQYALTYEGV
ncbi:hypothetical protein [Chondrinema litorale]|uniref:hypothetical protein n=1 Tax=Chondrinema litorale TaxID=2994555 RepID=UPI002543FA8D|nr:hypothetical protein [Chondrinema litorale]UZS00277.1 hypothetical protein OQ292_40765 [Chondrinema litorale]